jgi:structure-specific endonuclease subunit SLX1
MDTTLPVDDDAMPERVENKPSFVYLLVCSSGITYVGATVDLDHRLRQHNCELKGGAKATSIAVRRGDKWRRHCYVSGFPDWQAALQFEWRWKHMTRRLFSQKMTQLERRMLALDRICALDRSTTKAIPYSEWTMPLQIHIE